MTEKRPQLRYSSLADLCKLSALPDNVCQCFCCLRYISKVGKDTVKLDAGAHALLHIVGSNAQNAPELYHRQAFLLGKSEHFACFICEPNIKKTFKDMDSGKDIVSPSAFVHDAVQCMQHGKFTFKNFFPILKGAICLSSELHTTCTVYHHPLRRANWDSLESGIAFLEVLSTHSDNDDDQSTERLLWGSYECGEDFECRVRKTPPIDEIIALVRWQNRGASDDPLNLLASSYSDCCEETSSLRRALRNPSCMQVLTTTKKEIRARFTGQGCRYCAGCRDNAEQYQAQESTSYSSAILLSWECIHPYVSHSIGISQAMAWQPWSIRCTETNTIQLRSYEYYQEIMSLPSVPQKFKFISAREYYSVQLSQCFAMEKSKCVLR